MRFVTYSDGGPAEAGVLDGTTVVSLATIGGAAGFGSLQELIDAGPAGLDAASTALDSPDKTADLDAVELLAPLPRPLQIRDMLCFLDHLHNVGRVATAMGGGDPDGFEVEQVWRDAPRYYKANTMCVVGPGVEIRWPDGCQLLDFELELGIVIGRSGRDIAVDDALDHVFGYTVFNDMSARDLQLAEMGAGLGPAKGKDFDTGNVLGPCIVTADEVDPFDLAMVARLNGEEICRGSTAQMDHTIPEAIAYASLNETLYPGEILGSGTVPRGCLMEHGRSLSPGDLVELEIAGIGVLANPIGRPGAGPAVEPASPQGAAP